MRERLRSLPVFDTGNLPVFDPAAAPTDPIELFTHWLDDAVNAAVPAPHAAVLATASADGQVSARTLILKDLHQDGWYFATQSESPKGQDLAQNPHAAMTFFWPALGRQVRIQGDVEHLPAEAGAEDFRARPPGSRAAALVGRQSEPLASRQEYWDAFAAALAKVEADPSLFAPGWAAYLLRPQFVEFWQATADEGQIRLRYSASGSSGWASGLLWP